MTTEKTFTVADQYLEVLDLDKTLADTRHLQRTLEADVELHGINSDELRQARESQEGFDTVRYLRERAGATDEQIRDIQQTFIHAVGQLGIDRFLLPGAQELLDTIDAQGRASLILTTGGGEWQYWKLFALGLETRPFHITSGRYKSDLITRGYDACTESYYFGDIANLPDGATAYCFKNFRIADDNPKAFLNIPRDAIGYLVAHDAETRRHHARMALPEQVIAINGLASYTETLKSYN